MPDTPVQINPFVLYGLLVLVMLTPVIISFVRFFKLTSQVDKKYGVSKNTKGKVRGRKK